MGFTERQVRDALHAAAAAIGPAPAPAPGSIVLDDLLLADGSLLENLAAAATLGMPALKLLQERVEQPLQPNPLRRAPQRGAMDAFNPPLHSQGGPANPSPGNRPPGPRRDLAERAAPEALGRADSLAYAEQREREQLAEQLKTERRTKRREHELALQRIADDRRRMQVKAQTVQAVAPQGPLQEVTAQLSSDRRCLLVIRLPTGHTLRESFPGASSLESVRQHLLAFSPELSPAFSFLQTFPKRRFCTADLPQTLQALGLSPSATLCLVEPGPEPVARERLGPCPPPQAVAGEAEESAQLYAVAERASGGQSEALGCSGQRAVAGSPTGTSRLEELAFAAHHRWGRGQKLDSEEPTEEEEEVSGEAMSPEGPGEDLHLPEVLHPFLDHAQEGLRPQRSHQWPAEGNRLRAADKSRAVGPDLPLAVAQAAEQRLQQAATHSRESKRDLASAASPPGRLHPLVPPLFQLCLQGAVTLLTAPRKQYRSSLSSLAPTLAELLLAHLIRQGLLRPRSLTLFFGCPLQKLTLDCYPYATNQLLHQLRAFPSLRQLSLVSCSVITDQGLSVLQHLNRLQRLNLSACLKLTDNCLPFLTGLRQLSHLALDQTRVSDRGLAAFLLSAPPTLTHLSLNQTGITEGTLHLLPHSAPHLWVLSVKQTGVADVSALRQLKALQTLHLDSTLVNEASLRTLSSHQTLSTLTLSGVQSVDGNRALELVSGLPLVQMCLPSRHTVTDAGLASLCRLSGLVELDLTGYSHITDAGLQHLPQLWRLRRLSLCNTLATDVALTAVQDLLLLDELCLDRLRVSSVGVARCIVCLPHLQVLSLASTPVGDTVARLGIAQCKQLLKVNLSQTRLTDRGLHFLRQVALVHLNLDGSGVTAVGVANLLAACPTISSIRSSQLWAVSSEDLSDDDDDEGPS